MCNMNQEPPENVPPPLVPFPENINRSMKGKIAIGLFIFCVLTDCLIPNSHGLIKIVQLSAGLLSLFFTYEYATCDLGIVREPQPPTYVPKCTCHCDDPEKVSSDPAVQQPANNSDRNIVIPAELISVRQVVTKSDSNVSTAKCASSTHQCPKVKSETSLRTAVSAVKEQKGSGNVKFEVSEEPLPVRTPEEKKKFADLRDKLEGDIFKRAQSGQPPLDVELMADDDEVQTDVKKDAVKK